MSYTDLEIKSGDGKYLRLEAGKIVTFHILDKSPVSEMIHWVDKKKIKCTGKGCLLCVQGNKPKQRWITNVFDRETKTVRLFEFGPMIAKQIKSHAEMLADDGQTVHGVDIKIKTEGTNLDTEYTVAIKHNIDTLPDKLELLKIGDDDDKGNS